MFRSFLPLHNPVGFGISDFLVLAAAVLLVMLAAAAARLDWRARRLAERTGWCVLALTVLPIAMRLALLGNAPAPIPRVADDFAYLLAADTLAHGRLANPPHPMNRFFETDFVLQEPTYSSIYPLGPAVPLALGEALFGSAWAGVLLSGGVFCGLCYWMLRGWTTPGWALVGGLLAVAEFGPLQYWMNTYWGGAVAGIGGCLIFGALPRLRQCARVRDAVCLGAGFGVEALARPYETALLLAGVAVYLLAAFRREWRRLGRTAAVAALAGLPAGALILAHNHAVTGSWTTLPYVLSRYQYGIPTTFTFQPAPVPHRPLPVEQRLDYELQAAAHGPGTDSPRAFLERLGKRVRFARFFFLTPLYLALPFFVPAVAEFRFAWVLLCLSVVALGTTFYPYFYPHYVAAAACLLVLVSVIALERLQRWKPAAARIVMLLCGAHFVFWYTANALAAHPEALALIEYQSWDYVNRGDPQGRIGIQRQLAAAQGKQLVFVRYGPQHRFDPWVYNAADIDGARVVRALDLGPEEDEKLMRYYPDRTPWLLEPDAQPARLTPYR